LHSGSRRSPKEPKEHAHAGLKFDPNVLRDEKQLASKVEEILGLKDPGTFIGKTSGTTYRRVHEILVSALDKIAEVAHSERLKLESIEVAGQKVSGQMIEEVKKSLLALLTDLSEALIMVRYQKARGQISFALADYVEAVVRSVIDHIKNVENVNKEKLREIEKLATNARSLLDSLAVLVYEYTKAHARRSHEEEYE